MQILLSGCHSGTNPSPGLGTALSLARAFPSSRLIAKDHSPLVTGLHRSDVFSDLLLARPWKELDLEEHADEIRQWLADNEGWFISGLDLETWWLSGLCIDRALVPSQSALSAAAKPIFAAAADLGVRVPKFEPLSSVARAGYLFCVRHGWRVWLKGLSYEAEAVRSWRELEKGYEKLSETWGEQGLFLQQHIDGHEVSVAFAAYQGRLLDAVFMEKRAVTPEGKTWGAEISLVQPDLLRRLEHVVGELGWTGGAELEFVRDAAGELWLIDWNPRFPAWIHGATLAGHNLPALLVQAGSRQPFLVDPAPVSSQFVRIVTEIPARQDLPLPPPTEREEEEPLGKHPSGMPQLARRVSGPLPPNADGPKIAVPAPAYLAKLVRDLADVRTPAFVFDETRAKEGFSRTRAAAEPLAEPVVRAAYSVKTNPDAGLLRLAREHGLLAEVISGEELEWALSTGFEPAEVVYNGPVPLSPLPTAEPLHAVFADSAEGLARLPGDAAPFVGVRLRGLETRSRFGGAVEDWAMFRRLVGEVRSLPAGRRLGCSFHVQSSTVGLRRWRGLVAAAVEMAAALGEAAGREVEVFDLGGGWIPEEYPEFLADHLPALHRLVRERLPAVEELLFEPGKAIAEPSFVLLSRVLEVRRDDEEPEAVVDASVAELAQVRNVPKRVFAFPAAGDGLELATGPGRILGRLCMEDDILARRVELPEWLGPGHLVVFCDVGAYDLSMSYPFGRGGRR